MSSGTSGPSHMFPDADDTTTYLIEMPTGDWDDWKDAIPRSKPLYDRLHTLVQLDAEFAGEVDATELRLTSMKFDRVHQRCQTALQAWTDGDHEKVREELHEIRSIAEPHTG
jgi:hypothetical protein